MKTIGNGFGYCFVKLVSRLERYCFLVFALLFLMPLAGRAQVVYSCDFTHVSDTQGWHLANGSCANHWVISADTGAMYVTGVSSLANIYSMDSTSVVYAYRDVVLPRGAYEVGFDWRCMGESGYDYLRVFMVDHTLRPIGGQALSGVTANGLPRGSVALDGGGQLSGASVWRRQVGEVMVGQLDTFTLVFMWRNDEWGGSQPPAAVTNVQISRVGCPQPQWLYADSVTPTSFALHWHDLGGNAFQWIVELDTASQPYGTGGSQMVTDTFFVFSGLQPNTDYTAYVSAVCDSMVTAPVSYRLHTPCRLIDSLPYVQDFSAILSSTFVECWQRFGDTVSYTVYPRVDDYNHTLVWCTRADAPRQYVVLPGIDVGTIPMNDVQLTFDAMGTSNGYGHLFEVGVLSNPTDLGTFVPVDTVAVREGDPEHYVVDFFGYGGSGAYIALRDSGSVVGAGYAVFDNFEISYLTDCQPLRGLEVVSTGTTGALLAWDVYGQMHDRPLNYEVVVEPMGGGTSGADSTTYYYTVTETRCFLTDLVPGMTYKARVTVYCEGGSTSESDSVVFSTLLMPCSMTDTTVADTVVMGTGTSHVTGVPVAYYYPNSLCQSIYTAAELHGIGLASGMITGMDFSFTNNSLAKQVSLFVSTTDQAGYSSVSDMLPVYEEERVYGPAPHPVGTSGTVHYAFVHPVWWDGEGNIVVTLMVNQPDSVMQYSSSFYGNSTNNASAGVNSSLFRAEAAQPFTPDNCLELGSAGSSSYRPSVVFYVSPCAEYMNCGAPVVVVDSVGSDAVAVSWIPGWREGSWDVLYRGVGDTLWTVADMGIGTNHYIFQFLDANRQYELRVVPDCDSGSLYGQAVVTTACAAIATFPWVEDFEAFTAPHMLNSAMQPCWHRGTSYIYYSYPYLDTVQAHSGTHSLYFYTPSYSEASYYAYLVLPMVEEDVSDLMVSFYAYARYSGGDYRLGVGVMTDPTDLLTYEELAVVRPTHTVAWEYVEVYLDGYTGTGKYIALFAYPASTPHLYIDDLTVEVIPACPRPRSVTIGTVTQHTASLHWQGSGADSYVVEYGPAGFAPGSGSMVSSLVDTVMLTALRHTTTYDVYVRCVCGGDTSDRSPAVTFTTGCGMVDSLPYTENFEGWGTGLGVRPSCWSYGGYVYLSGTNYPYITSVSDNMGGEGRCLYVPTISAADRAFVALPAVDTALHPLRTLQAVVKARGGNFGEYYSNMLVVGLSHDVDPLATFVPIDTFFLTDESVIHVIPLGTVAGGGSRFTLMSVPQTPEHVNSIYIDSVAIDLLPSCQSPVGLTASAPTQTTATLAWQARGSVTQWQVECIPDGAATGTLYNAAVDSITLTGLTPATFYECRVRGICAGGDTSEWCSQACRFTTLQQPATVPYATSFDTVADWTGWQTMANASVGWYRGMSAGSPAPGIYVSADSGAHWGTYGDQVVNAVAFRDIDFGSVDTSFTLSFSAVAEGAHNNNDYYDRDGLAVFLADPAEVPLRSSHISQMSPWGALGDLTPLATVQGVANWHNYNVALENISGVHRLVFYWHNDNTAWMNMTAGVPAAVDNINIAYVACPRPFNVAATDVSTIAATIVWQGPATGSYRVVLSSQTGRVVSTDTVSTNSIRYSPLNPGTLYHVSVARLCDDDASLLSDQCSFVTNSCVDVTTNHIGDSLSTPTESNYIPVNACYNYSYTQQIVLASELGTAGEITGIQFYYDSYFPMIGKTACTILLGHTTLSSFSSLSDYVSPEEMQTVYIGALRFTQGWNRIYFESPFTYDGTSNLVIAVDDNSRARYSTDRCFAVAAADRYMTLALYSSIQDIDCSSLSTLNDFTGSRRLFSYRNMMRIDICPPNPCPKPILQQPRVHANDVTLRWRNTGESYLVGYRWAGSDNWIEDNIHITDTFYLLDRFMYGSDYVYYVRQYCDSVNVSYWALGSFNTSEIPCLPPLDLRVVRATNRKAWFTWMPEDNHISYRLHVWGGGGYDTVVTTYLANGLVEELNPSCLYYAAVQVQCEYLDEPSLWSDTVTFTTRACPDATDLTADEVYGNAALIDWRCAEDDAEWMVEWGLTGFDQGMGTTVIADHHPYLLTGLTGETTYDIIVRTICDTDYVSESWSNRLTITTAQNGIETDEFSILNAQFSLSPNPTTGDVQLLMPAAVGTVRVEIVDMEGRVCLSCMLPSGTECATLNTRTLSAGAYYMRATTDDMSVVKKLLKIERLEVRVERSCRTRITSNP